MVAIRLPAQLGKYAGGTSRLMAAATTVAGALAEAAELHPPLGPRLFGEDGTTHPHLIVFVGDEEVTRDRMSVRAVGPDDEISVVIGVSGGAVCVEIESVV